jgi:hypothetical protein
LTHLSLILVPTSCPVASSTCLTAAIHLSQPTVSLEYIVVEEETKYLGEMWVKSLLFILFLVDSPFPPPHLQILYPTASSTCPTSLDTHPSWPLHPSNASRNVWNEAAREKGHHWCLPAHILLVRLCHHHRDGSGASEVKNTTIHNKNITAFIQLVSTNVRGGSEV